MKNIIKISLRNLLRFKRRTFLTASLISFGVIFVIIFESISGSFKAMIIGQITDSMLGHIQIHKKGYVASTENSPLNLNLKEKAFNRSIQVLNSINEIEYYSPRVKFSGMLSNYIESTGIRLNGIYPEKEFKTVPLLQQRIVSGSKSLNKGEILIPDLLFRGLKLKLNDTLVIIATNKDGSVNGKQFKLVGVLESITGPGGRDGYIHIEDASDLLKIEQLEVSELALRLRNFSKLKKVSKEIDLLLAKELNKEEKAIYEVHSWDKLSPFAHIAGMIDLMSIFIKVMLIAIVLISVMNIMIMAVYERIREIGTIAAIGTLPKKILSMFLIEGLFLGLIGAISGSTLSIVIIFIINLIKIHFSFGKQENLLLIAKVYPVNIVFASVIVVLVATIASFWPAYKASKMEPIKALKHL